MQFECYAVGRGAHAACTPLLPARSCLAHHSTLSKAKLATDAHGQVLDGRSQSFFWLKQKTRQNLFLWARG